MTAAALSNDPASEEVIIPTIEGLPIAPQQSWTASPGDYLTLALESWAETEGWTVQNLSGSIWKITVPVEITGSFENAVSTLVSGFQRTSPRPEVTLYPNKIIVIRKNGEREANNDA